MLRTCAMTLVVNAMVKTKERCGAGEGLAHRQGEGGYAGWPARCRIGTSAAAP